MYTVKQFVTSDKTLWVKHGFICSYNQNRLNNFTKPLTNCLIILQTHGGFHILCYMSESKITAY